MFLYIINILETPITCWDHYTDMNAVNGLVTSVRTQDRPNSFYFGDMGDDVEACAGACARESNCHVRKFGFCLFKMTLLFLNIRDNQKKIYLGLMKEGGKSSYV